MTVPDPTVPTAEDVIAEAIHSVDCGCTDWHPHDPEDQSYDDQADAVVAAVRSMSVEQLHDLRPDLTVERLDRPEWFDTGEPRPATWGGLVGAEEATRRDLRFVPSVRVVGPWQETP